MAELPSAAVEEFLHIPIIQVSEYVNNLYVYH